MIEIILKSIDNVSEGMLRTDVLETFDDIKSTINNTVLPTLGKCIDYTKQSDLEVNKISLIKSIVNRTDIKTDSVQNVLIKVKDFLLEIETNIDSIYTISEEILPNKIMKSSINLQVGTILALQDIFISTAAFSLDICLEVLNKEKLSKAKRRELDLATLAFVKIYRVLKGKIKKDIGNIKKLSTEPLTQQNKFRLSQESYPVSASFSLPVNDFIGLPIYHFRKWLVDRDVAKYKLLESKKKLIELKIINLESGESSEKTKKAITYYEKEIESIEYRLTEIEV